MNYRDGITQRSLRRLECHWGNSVRKHQLLVAVFHSDHKVKGFIGFSVEENPVWYPGVPLIVTRNRLTFKSANQDRPPAWGEVERELFQGVYFFDAWGALASVLPAVPDAPPLAGGINLARATVESRPIVDVVFEPHLHRLRALLVRHRGFFTRRMEVMTLGAFAEVIQSGKRPRGMDYGKGPASGNPPPVQEGFFTRWLRRALTGRDAGPGDRL